jgi:peptidylprolyl isomerase
MRLRLLAPAALLSFAGCLGDTTTGPTAERIPIDCATLATSLAASEASLTTTSTGLKFRDQAVGTGATVTSGQTVAVHYSGCLVNGTKFDENTNVDPPLVFRLGASQVIAGFDQGIVGMKIGGRRQLVIPPALGYGGTQNGAIPPNSTLVFTVDAVAAQ